MTHVLVFGSTGQLASELKRAEWANGTAVTFLGRDEADLSAPETLGDVMRERRPDAVIIAAAYTAVDRAESEEALAHRVNAESPGMIAKAAAGLDAPVIFISTDYVFGGRHAMSDSAFYTELDAPAPLNAYGRSKLSGEEKVRKGNPRHLILRTSWLYGAHGTNFVKTMISLAESRKHVEVVDDQFGCPTASADLAQEIAGLVPCLLEPEPAYGLYHLAGPDDVSWYGLSDLVFRNLEARGMKRPQNLPIPSAVYRSAAQRPSNSRLCSSRIREVFGISLPPLEERLPKVLHELLDA